MTDDTKPEGVSPGMLEFFNGLTPEQREGLTEALRDPLTFIAEDFDDVLAILKHLKTEKANEKLPSTDT